MLTALFICRDSSRSTSSISLSRSIIREERRSHEDDKRTARSRGDSFLEHGSSGWNCRLITSREGSMNWLCWICGREAEFSNSDGTHICQRCVDGAD